jgi:hypothetical protein
VANPAMAHGKYRMTPKRKRGSDVFGPVSASVNKKHWIFMFAFPIRTVPVDAPPNNPACL